MSFNVSSREKQSIIGARKNDKSLDQKLIDKEDWLLGFE
jgi:hypothetical protein